MTNTTVTANQAVTGGGFFQNGGTLALANSVIAGNTATGANADLGSFGTLADNGGNYFSTAVGTTSTLTPKLLPLANYGGPIQTMLPAPLSPLLCQGTAANATTAGLILDERNDPRTTTYGATSCVDIGCGAVELLAQFRAAADDTILGLPITLHHGAVEGERHRVQRCGPARSYVSHSRHAERHHTAEYERLRPCDIPPTSPSAQRRRTTHLKSTLPLSTSPAISVSATSNTFNVIAPVSTFTITGLPSSTTAGTAVGFTVTAMNGSSILDALHRNPSTISSTQDPLLAFVGRRRDVHLHRGRRRRAHLHRPGRRCIQDRRLGHADRDRHKLQRSRDQRHDHCLRRRTRAALRSERQRTERSHRRYLHHAA